MIDDSNRSPSPNQPRSSADSQVPADEASQDKSWQELAEKASQETDPQKLLTLVKDLCSALDGENKPPANSQNNNSSSDDGTSRRTNSK